MWGHEWQLFQRAIGLLTILPDLSRDSDVPVLNSHAAKYFPLVGLGVGVLTGVVIAFATTFLPQPLPVVLGLIAGVALTGARHESGLARAADQFGPDVADAPVDGNSSRAIGSYGALAIIAILALKGVALSTMGPISVILALIAGFAAARLAIVAVMQFEPRGDDNLASSDFALACAFVVLPGLVLLSPLTFVFGLIGGGLAALPLISVYRRRTHTPWAGGLDAIQQVFEAGFLVGAAAAIAGPG